MFNKAFLQKLGFIPKDNASDIFYKKYPVIGNYCIEIDLEKERFNFGHKIKSESGTTQNFSQEESWVVFECVNRLLEKGYEPEDMILEKSFKVGHGASGGRLDILVKKEGKAFLMIECKTWGNEFEKEFKKMQKDGGQLFSYFQQDNKAEYLMLYASQFDEGKINYKNEIIKIEKYYLEAGNVKDFYDRWNKLFKQNGIFEDWVNAYEFQNKALTKKDLKPLEKEDSVSLFNKFEAILRKHTVSDGPNAFNKIFNLFLAKIFDEKKRETDELDFQWKEGRDDDVNFQIRLINLHKEGMWEFLRKEVEGITDSDLAGCNTEKEIMEKKKKWLKFNKIFDIKEVFDDESFEDNARVLKEITELLSKYQVRYPRKQQHLSDFFERLLTTGLKQKAGQFFTPPPIARFVIKSLPLKEAIIKKLSEKETPELPAIIDYAAGSGHFLTESMEEMQKIIDNIETKSFYPDVIKKVNAWKEDKFDWASKYIYGIEKDYRLVKVAKVGCYFYGDGVAQVIYGDGLDNFSESKSYRGILRQEKKNQDHPVFDFVISNPPYSVQRFRADIKNKAPEESFELYEDFTDNSKEIECLFIERTKQLLRNGGIAAVILPSSILSNGGVYTKAREVLFKYFEIVAITELGSGTFMATGTNTVILFLCRRANHEWENIQSAVNRFFQNYQDFTVNGLENIYSRYANFVWGGISFEDFVSLCQNKPNEKIKKHDIYKEYEKKIKAKNDKDKQEMILRIEKEKLLYFILAYSQKVVVVKSGKKKEEKAFLGYDFSNRRGYEGIHSIQRSKPIDECTKMFDPENQENPEKADYYVRKAFLGEFDLEISDSMKPHIFQTNLVDMMTFDRVDFEKTISTTIKKTSESKSKWEMIKLGDVVEYQQGFIYSKNDESNNKTSKKILTASNIDLETNSLILDKVRYLNETKNINSNFSLKKEDIFICTSSGSRSHVGKNIYIKKNYPNFYFGGFCAVLRSKGAIKQGIIHSLLQTDEFRDYAEGEGGQNINNLKRERLLDFKIPLPPLDIQEKIVSEIKKLESRQNEISIEISDLNSSVKNLLKNKGRLISVEDLVYSFESKIVKIRRSECQSIGKYPVISQEKEFIIGYTDNENPIVDVPVIVFGDHNCFFKYVDFSFFQGADGIKILKPDVNKILPKFLFYNLQDLEIENADKYMRHYSYLKVKKIAVPAIKDQQKIVIQIEKIENRISKLNQESQEIKKQKDKVLKKYL